VTTALGFAISVLDSDARGVVGMSDATADFSRSLTSRRIPLLARTSGTLRIELVNGAGRSYRGCRRSHVAVSIVYGSDTI
jgi:hypothetical protein